MLRSIVMFLFLLSSTEITAHQPDRSTTTLIESQTNEWLLHINAALAAFQFEIETSPDRLYNSSEAFREAVIRHVQNNLWIRFNGNQEAVLQNAQVNLGHETRVVFELEHVPAELEMIEVSNSSFKNIDQHQNTLIILKTGFSREQFILEDANDYHIQLLAEGAQLVELKTSNAFPVKPLIMVFVGMMIVAMSSLYFINLKLEPYEKVSWKGIYSIGGIVGILVVLACTSQKETLGKVDAGEKEKVQIESEVPDHFFGSYHLADEHFGTQTKVQITGGKRIMETNVIPNHKTGQFPNSGNPNRISAQKRTYEIPLNPVYTGIAKWAREPGVALNGVKFEPQTAEVIQCESGENYRVEAIQDLIDLGLDFNHAHVQPTGAYHYHGPPAGVIEAFDRGEDLVHIGFALDGFPVYYSKSGQYKPSYRIIDDTRTGTDCNYSNPMESHAINIAGTKLDGTFLSDWEYVRDLGDLDECNGIEIDGQYRYLITDEYPYIGRCLMGEFKETRRRGPPPRGRRGAGRHHPGAPR